jgi:hypothetical protein
LDRILRDEVKEGGPGGYVIFDTPGQVELWTNHGSLRRIIDRLIKLDYRVGNRTEAVEQANEVLARGGASL